MSAVYLFLSVGNCSVLSLLALSVKVNGYDFMKVFGQSDYTFQSDVRTVL